MAENFLWPAIQAAREGLSANQAYQRFRELGLGLRRATFLKVYGEAKAALANRVEEVTKPIEGKPRAADILHMTTKTATGYMQYVDIYVRDRTTGEVFATPYGIRSDELGTRADVIASALDKYGSHAPFYDQQVLGATYTATYLLAPDQALQ